MSLNRFQLAVAQAYGDGDFAHVTDMTQADMVGDTLFLFIMRELDEPGIDLETASYRMERAIDDVRVAANALEKLEA